MVEFLREYYPYHTNKECVEALEEKFGIKTHSRNMSNVKTLYKLPDKMIKNAGCFEKGLIPWNKDKPMSEETRKKVARTWFKKGHTLSNRDVGETRVNADGYKAIKVAQPNEWMLYHRYIYEKETGEKLEPSDIVIFADGDRGNFEIDNLVKVTREDLLYLNREGLIYDDKDLTKAGVNIAKLLSKIRARKEE